jgi:hypothetical protein
VARSVSAAATSKVWAFLHLLIPFLSTFPFPLL